VHGPEGQERQASIQRSDSTTASTGEQGRSGSRVPFARLDTPSITSRSRAASTPSAGSARGLSRSRAARISKNTSGSAPRLGMRLCVPSHTRSFLATAAPAAGSNHQ
jgi:hypothetical protein